MAVKNPFGFTTGPVTFWLIVVYAAFLIPLVWIHESVPAVPSNSKNPYPELNVTEAWLDLTHITRKYHPYNSRANEEVGAYFLERIEEILVRNKVEYTKEKNAGGVIWPQEAYDAPAPAKRDVQRTSTGPAVTIFDDTISNTTYLGTLGSFSEIGPFATYFEGTNKLVYIRGTQDEDGEWWNGKRDPRKIGEGGVLVNAHYDSVSTGYGATDDGMGCVSLLQMLNYYTSPGRQPRRGIVLLLNNGEEDGLYGARVYHYSPLYYFTTSFVNLEGAGAGGRAILFRTTDLEVTKGYEGAPHPFGSVVAADGFKLGAIRSETDYKVWTEAYGQRGLDIAFYRPRARYHTNQDDTRHASQDSLWHMLSNGFAAVDNLQQTTGYFSGKRSDGDKKKVASGSGTDGVWFDMFGTGFAILELRGLFAWTLTLLIVSPLVLALVTYILSRKGKYYFFSRKVKVDEDDEPVSLGGWKGFFRFPLALVLSASITALSVFLIRKVNPHIVYSSPYAVWAMTLSLFFLVFWTISKGASVVRPSALQRGYAHIWLFVISWAILVVVTAAADRFKIASGYPFAFFHSAIFVSTFISLCDLFALPSKKEFAQNAHDDQQTRDNISEVPNSDALISSHHSHAGDDDEEEPTETTPLRSGENGDGNNGTIRTTFATTYRRSLSAIMRTPGEEENKETELQPYDDEQQWSAKLPSWTWFFQLLLLAPITITVFLQVALFIVSAINSAAADGNDPLLVYAAIAAFSIIILLPTTPFIHRASYYLPIFLLFVFFITLIYNLVAFPFSAENRLKVRFQQTLDLDEKTSVISIFGLEKYTRKMIAELPSGAGQPVNCSFGIGLTSLCRYNGTAVMPNLPRFTHALSVDLSKDRYANLVTVNVSRSNSSNKLEFGIDATESKACTLTFNTPVSFNVHGSAGIDPIFSQPTEQGVSSLTLWRRNASIPWVVDVEPSQTKAVSYSVPVKSSGFVAGAVHEDLRIRKPAELSGTIACQWSDANVRGTIPAFDEALQFAPDWIAVTKASVGLVEAKMKFRG
ncbi:putative zinc metalloprotease [Colletotrichum sublineola]|uniref:Peptide hydrolase n=1 Tax=Colletotrichum sublineola TaxID=1173701 RepID=A0A066XVK6_COLSU|nr:putative zinc metalloprotease [Colletotrichum sublineola]KDN69796.1 putative peptidase family M28 [Colletotrichum sublineola]